MDYSQQQQKGERKRKAEKRKGEKRGRGRKKKSFNGLVKLLKPVACCLVYLTLHYLAILRCHDKKYGRKMSKFFQNLQFRGQSFRLRVPIYKGKHRSIYEGAHTRDLTESTW